MSYNAEDWRWWLAQPFKCSRCMRRWDELHCSADMYKWVRDAEHIDDEDCYRMLAYCPSIGKAQPEPEEWQETASEAAARKQKEQYKYNGGVN